MRRCSKAAEGFTVIEFVMILIMLSVLSAYAFPRFAKMSNQAESSLIEEALSSVRASAGTAHAHWLAAGKPNHITIDGLKVATQNGYPSANVAMNLTQDDAKHTELGLIAKYDNTICGLAGLSAHEYRCETDAENPRVIHITGAKAELGSACFRYQVPESPDGRPVFSRVLQSPTTQQFTGDATTIEGWHTNNKTCMG